MRALASPVPTQTTSGSDGATATSPTEATGWSSKTGAQESPSLTVFQTPPDAAATYIVAGRLSTTATAVTRPLMLPGPSGGRQGVEELLRQGVGVCADGGEGGEREKEDDAA